MEHPIAHDEDQDVAVTVPTHKESICFQAAQDQSCKLYKAAIYCALYL